MRMLALGAVSFSLLLATSVAQERGKLPAPPKPPRWLKNELGDKLPTPKVAPEEVPPPEAAREPAPGHGRRPVRVRINTPWINLNLGFNRGAPESKAVEVDVNLRGNKHARPGMGPIKRLAERWRYRRHNGRWWYWMPSERWAVWDNNRWIEVTKEMLKAGELRLGTPRRGNVRVKVGELPGLNVGF